MNYGSITAIKVNQDVLNPAAACHLHRSVLLILPED